MQPQKASGRAQISPTSAETNEPSTIAAIATNGASVTASKNLQADEMMPLQSQATKIASFHPRIKYSLKQTHITECDENDGNSLVMPTLHTPVLVPNVAGGGSGAGGGAAQPINQNPDSAMTPISAAMNVKPQAAAIAEALLRNGYHNFQQQLRAQEILLQRSPRPISTGVVGGVNGNIFAGNGDLPPGKILENFLRKQQAATKEKRSSECETVPELQSEDGEDSRLNGFDDIHLMENAVPKFANTSLPIFPTNGSGVTASAVQDAQALAFRSIEFNLSDFGGSSNGSSTSPIENEPSGEFRCSLCGKCYRWKSTLRRHENVECGGKEPSHQCPYCPYKSKQRGNLGVHVRKHHTELPQLPSKRRSKYSVRVENGNATATATSSSTATATITSTVTASTSLNNNNSNASADDSKNPPGSDSVANSTNGNWQPSSSGSLN